MSAQKRYQQIFGKFESLEERLPWTAGLSNMFEWLCWDPKEVLGKEKGQYWRQIVDWCAEPELSLLSPDEKKEEIKKRLKREGEDTQQPDRYSKPGSGNLKGLEAFRQAKYFSENYLNKEFDVFWSLVSDSYLDAFYGGLLTVQGGGSWASQGQSGLFQTSTGIKKMQIDNISYNGSERLLIGNELKLGGAKNKDQMLKYAYMFLELKAKGFIATDTDFALLFISHCDEGSDWQGKVEAEIDYCLSKGKLFLCEDSVKEAAFSATYASITWKEVLDFNVQYLGKLEESAQVERKLLEGFNLSVSQKKVLQ